jgi:diaminohydroxyphosphoribosylaminopyrimidine deaminase/5-amino-6-(5-phosphoribosylamino)uracil reductase
MPLLTDEFYMRRALLLARRGEGGVSPNPMVGAVIVKGERIIGEGYHERFGGAHAEVNAIRRAKEGIKGSTVYVNLEPCSHCGKTPPCVDSLVACKPGRVVIGILDPNPLVSGTGMRALQDHGIETTVGVLEDQCRELNERFFTFITTRRPFVTLKFAQTLDGRIATATGDSRWISSLASRKFAHRLRAIHDGILVGVGTVLRDDPDLTCRLVRGRNPVRIVVDSELRTPLDVRLLKDQEEAKTIVACTPRATTEKRTRLEAMGIETISIDPDGSGNVDLEKLFSAMGRRGLSSVLVEGGSTVITSVLRAELADRLVVIIAPKIVGKGIEAVGELGIRRMDDARPVSFRRIMQRGGDVIFDGRISGSRWRSGERL